MRLVYVATGLPVNIGDPVAVSGQQFTVQYTPEPHKPSSEGKVSLLALGADTPLGTEFYVSVIGARWIEREDRPLRTHADAYDEFRVLYLEAAARQDAPAADPADAWREFIGTAIAQGRAPASAADWKAPTLTA